jgi:hypothetical protein
MRRWMRRISVPGLYWLKSRPSRFCSTAQIVTRWAARSWRTPSGDLNAITRLAALVVQLRRLRIFGQRDKLKADRSKRGVISGRKEEAAQRRIQSAGGDGSTFRGEDPGGADRRSLGFIRR